MCCLIYEHKTYVDARRRFPREGKTLQTAIGKELVRSVDILAETVTLTSKDGQMRTVLLNDLELENARRSK